MTPEQRADSVVKDIRDHEMFNIITDDTWRRYIASAIKNAVMDAMPPSKGGEDCMVQCPACGGMGAGKKWPGDRTPEHECSVCEGLGEVTEDQFQAYHERHKG